MSWIVILLVIVLFVVCAELYTLRDLLNQLHKKVDELNERLSRKRIEELRKDDE